MLRSISVPPAVVLAAEGVEGQDPDATPAGMAEDAPDGLHAGRMALQLRQAALARPAAVAVHDDRDVVGQLRARRLGQRQVGSLGDGDPLHLGDGSRLVGRGGRVGRSDERCAGH
jgi:hypothetical protein